MAITRPPFCAVAPIAVGGRARDGVALGVRALVTLERRHAGVQHERRDADPPAHQIGDHLGGERTRPRSASRRCPARARTRSGTPRSATRAARGGSGSDGRARRGSRGARRRRSNVAVASQSRRESAKRRVQPHPSESEQVDLGRAVDHARRGRAAAPVAAPRPAASRRAARRRSARRRDRRRAGGRRPRAGTVADVFTTTRSPARRNSPRAVKRACTGAASPSLTSNRTWSRRPPAASGGWCASCSGSSTKPSVGTDDARGVRASRS